MARFHSRVLGYTPEQIVREFPGLSLDKVYATITYYLTHRAEVDDYLIRTREQDERDYQESLKHPSPLRERLRSVRAQRIEQAMKAPPIICRPASRTRCVTWMPRLM